MVRTHSRSTKLQAVKTLAVIKAARTPAPRFSFLSVRVVIERWLPFSGDMNTFGELKDILLGHLSRNGVSMQTEGGSDMVAVAINSAMTHIQRKRDFEWNKITTQVNCNPKGNLLTQSLDLDTGEAVTIKRINVAYGVLKPELAGGPKVDYLSRTSQAQVNTYASGCPTALKVIHSGSDVFAVPTPEGAYKLYFEAIKWLPKLVHQSDTNFVLTYGFDYMIYRSLQELNFYIKEDQRFEINTVLLRGAEEGLMQWDMNLISPTETEIDF